MSPPPPHRPSQPSERRATLLAAGAGLALFCFYLVTVTVGGTLAPLDGELLSLSSDITARIPRGAVARVSELGALPAAVLLVLAAVALLAVRRRPAEGLALALGFLAIFFAVDLIKEEVDRPRPPAPGPPLSTASFPSGHAAYATAWTAVALALVRLAPPAMPRALRVTVVAGGIVVTVLIGLTRLLLGAHYWSDVVAGWALGFAIFALAAASASAVASMRHTERRTEAPAPEPRSAPP
jgi:undecaprenyl-diphosphatase